MREPDVDEDSGPSPPEARGAMLPSPAGSDMEGASYRGRVRGGRRNEICQAGVVVSTLLEIPGRGVFSSPFFPGTAARDSGKTPVEAVPVNVPAALSPISGMPFPFLPFLPFLASLFPSSSSTSCLALVRFSSERSCYQHTESHQVHYIVWCTYYIACRYFAGSYFNSNFFLFLLLLVQTFVVAITGVVPGTLAR